MTSDAPRADDLLGQTLASQFHVLERLGAGGMGAVYLAEQTDMARRVVIKVMHPELTAGNAQAVERFKREARAVAALNHPHIVQVYVFGQAADGRLYLAMEHIEGRDLAMELAGSPMGQGRALRIVDQIAAALIEAHSRGVVHRDLKPENVMLADRHGNPDWVKVLDFGIAKVAASAQDGPALTQQGAIFGTPRYMAPEQITGGIVDARTDLYALGVILYEMLTGEHPFRATSAIDYLMKHVQDEVVLPSVARPGLGVHPRVEAILARLLAKPQAERFQSAAELQREVRATMGAIGEALSHTLSITPSALDAAVRESERAAAPPAREPPTRSHAPLRWLALGVVVAGIVAALLLRGSGPPAPRERTAVLVPREPVADTHTPADSTTTPGDAAPASIDAGSRQSKIRAASPIGGFPVPEGTTLLTSEPLQLRLESALSGQALLDFYSSELAGRIRQVGSGFEVTDPASPWTRIHLSNNGDRILIVVGRKAEPTQATPDAPPPAVAPPPRRAPPAAMRGGAGQAKPDPDAPEKPPRRIGPHGVGPSPR